MTLNIRTLRTSLFTSLLILIISLFLINFIPKYASAAYDGSRIIDDSIFLNAASMTAPDIQTFLVARGGAIANKSFAMDCTTAGTQANNAYIALGAPCGQTVLASSIIYYTAQVYGVNPRVIIATMQKEQSLITATNPTNRQYVQAMGYGCPTTGSCDDSSNFFWQVDNGTWVLRFHYERAKKNMSWWYVNSTWTCGTEKNFYKPNLYPGQNVNFYDEDGVMYRTHFIANAATSAFYCYTPHAYNNPLGLYGRAPYGTVGRYYSGSYNFVYFYELWFGSTKTGICYGGSLTSKTDVQLQKSANGVDSPTFLILSGSGSGCVEAHAWNSDLRSWKNHIASNQSGITTPDAKVLYGDLDGDNRDYPVLFGLKSTGSGMIESHVWEKTMGSYLVHAASNRAVINPEDNEIVFGDLNGDGKEEPILVAYRNTGSGMIELHGWGEGTQTWLYHIATNRPTVDPVDNRVVFGDIDGDKKTEAILVSINGTGSGRIEFHVWNPGQSSWKSNIASNMSTVNPLDAKVEFGDFDANATDEAMLIGMRGTGSGKIEFHLWNPGFTSWKSNTASNQTSPAQ